MAAMKPFSTRSLIVPHFTGLDAVRGCACMVVLLYHCLYAMPPAGLAPLLNSNWGYPIRLVTNGEAAVILFFWLSGYVLALPFFRGPAPGYVSFLVKRFCRLYIPFAAVVGLATLAYHTVGVKPDLADINPMLNLQYERLTGVWLTGHFLVLGRSEDIDIDTVVWTLVHEMRISLIFPLLVLLCRYRGLAIALALVDLGIAHFLLIQQGASEPWVVDRFSTSMLWTMSFVPHFIGGILLCRSSDRIRSFLRGTSFGVRVAALAAAVTLLVLPQSYMFFSLTLLYGLSAAVIMMLSFDLAFLNRLLDTRLLQGLGRISYSIYLVHIPVLLVTGYVMAKNYSYTIVGAAAFAGSLVIAALFHRAVEQPAMKLGRKLASQSDLAMHSKNSRLRHPKSPKNLL